MYEHTNAPHTHTFVVLGGEDSEHLQHSLGQTGGQSAPWPQCMKHQEQATAISCRLDLQRLEHHVSEQVELADDPHHLNWVLGVGGRQGVH